MKREEIAKIIKSIGLPYSYYQFAENSAPKLPYLVFYYPLTRNVFSDDTVFAEIDDLNIELYTSKKDFKTEEKVESVLKENGFLFDKSESYLTDENMFEVLYETSCVIDA
jgi:hypothetical protein